MEKVSITVFTQTLEKLKNYIKMKNCMEQLSTNEINELKREDTQNVVAQVLNLDKNEAEWDEHNISMDISVDCDGKVSYSTINRSFESLAKTISIMPYDEFNIHICLNDIIAFNKDLESPVIKDVIMSCLDETKMKDHYNIIEDD